MELLQDHNEPLYLQLKKILRTAVVNGEYVPGQQIPTEQELMKQYNVSRITVRRAIQELINEKYLIKSQGKGTFVSQTRLSRELVKLKSFTEGCEDNHQVAKSQVLSVTVDKANKHDISRLGVSAEDKVIHITRLRFRDDVPFLIEHSYYQYPQYEFLLHHNLSGSIYAILKEKLGLIPARSEKSVEIAYATAEQAQLLGINKGAALFLMRTVVYDEEDCPVHHNIVYLDGVTYRFSF